MSCLGEIKFVSTRNGVRIETRKSVINVDEDSDWEIVPMILGIPEVYIYVDGTRHYLLRADSRGGSEVSEKIAAKLKALLYGSVTSKNPVDDKSKVSSKTDKIVISDCGNDMLAIVIPGIGRIVSKKNDTVIFKTDGRCLKIKYGTFKVTLRYYSENKKALEEAERYGNMLTDAFAEYKIRKAPQRIITSKLSHTDSSKSINNSKW